MGGGLNRPHLKRMDFNELPAGRWIRKKKALPGKDWRWESATLGAWWLLLSMDSLSIGSFGLARSVFLFFVFCSLFGKTHSELFGGDEQWSVNLPLAALLSSPRASLRSVACFPSCLLEDSSNKETTHFPIPLFLHTPFTESGNHFSQVLSRSFSQLFKTDLLTFWFSHLPYLAVAQKTGTKIKPGKWKHENQPCGLPPTWKQSISIGAFEIPTCISLGSHMETSNQFIYGPKRSTWFRAPKGQPAARRRLRPAHRAVRAVRRARRGLDSLAWTGGTWLGGSSQES